MKIILIGQKGIPAKGGGVERHVEELAVRLVKAGHDVLAYTRPNYTDASLKEYKGVKLVSLPSISHKNLDAISHTFFACLNIIFKQKKVDIVHFHSIGPSSLLWLIRIFKPRVKVIATFHSKCYEHQKWGLLARTYLKVGEFVACNFAHKTITVSKNLKNYVKEKYGKEVDYIPNGVPVPVKVESRNEIRKWNLEKESYFFTASRLVRHKGIHYLIQAFKQLKTNKKLVIAGDGAYTDSYVEELRELAGDNPNIIFTGNQSGNTLNELFSNAYAFISASESEGLSIALLEAMAHELPVLVSDIPENIEASEDAGLYFENKNVLDLADKMNILLSCEEKVKEMKVKGLERVKKEYDWENIVDNVLSVYKDSDNKNFQVFNLKAKARV